MDHVVTPRPCKIRDWMLNVSWDHFGLHQGKKCQSDHEVWGPHKTYCKAYIIYWHGPTGSVWEEKKSCSSKKKGRGPWQRNNVITNFEWILFGKVKTSADKRRQKNSQIWIFLSRILKESPNSILVHGHSSWSTSQSREFYTKFGTFPTFYKEVWIFLLFT